jgi:hypothetical protein
MFDDVARAEYSGAVPAAVVPAIYATSPVPQKLSPAPRLGAAIIAIACVSVLAVATTITPSPAGFGTHTDMGFPACNFLAVTGLPCPSCGMTTSFAWFVRGNVLASLYVQPAGTLLAAAAGMMFWAGVYIAATGKPVYRLLARLPGPYYVIVPLAIGIAAWAWKIFLQLRGIDGWG